MTRVKYRREMSHWVEFMGLARARAYGKFFRLVLLAAGALPMLLAIAASTLWPGSLDATSFLFGFLCALLIVGLLSRFGGRRHVKDPGWILGNREMTLTDEGLVDAGNGAELKVDWPAIEGVSVAKGIIVMWTDRAAGFFIPRNAFASADKERSFVDFVGKSVGRVKEAQPAVSREG